MRSPLAAVICFAYLLVSNSAIFADSATEQVAPVPVKQMALTKKQIEGVLAAKNDMNEINEKLSEKAKPYLVVEEELQRAAKKYGFASYDEYNNVVENIALVLAGFDPTTKKYIGSDALVRAQIAQIQADKGMPAEERKEALAELNAALKSPAPPVENKGNIDLVAEYYNRLAEAMGNDHE